MKNDEDGQKKKERKKRMRKKKSKKERGVKNYLEPRGGHEIYMKVKKGQQGVKDTSTWELSVFLLSLRALFFIFFSLSKLSFRTDVFFF